MPSARSAPPVSTLSSPKGRPPSSHGPAFPLSPGGPRPSPTCLPLLYPPPALPLQSLLTITQGTSTTFISNHTATALEETLGPACRIPLDQLCLPTTPGRFIQDSHRLSGQLTAPCSPQCWVTVCSPHSSPVITARSEILLCLKPSGGPPQRPTGRPRLMEMSVVVEVTQA